MNPPTNCNTLLTMPIYFNQQKGYVIYLLENTVKQPYRLQYFHESTVLNSFSDIVYYTDINQFPSILQTSFHFRQ